VYMQGKYHKGTRRLVLVDGRLLSKNLESEVWTILNRVGEALSGESFMYYCII